VATVLLADLEQAELESRARRLAAEAEADRRLAAAQTTADAIAATAGDEIETALAALRRRYADQADAEIERLRTELAELEARAGEHPGTGPGFEAAVDVIVAAVLGEREA
jgi:ElaB/YqjD/DUF883 family membrane-anchored ribosome-binding protein